MEKSGEVMSTTGENCIKVIEICKECAGYSEEHIDVLFSDSSGLYTNELFLKLIDYHGELTSWNYDEMTKQEEIDWRNITALLEQEPKTIL